LEARILCATGELDRGIGQFRIVQRTLRDFTALEPENQELIMAEITTHQGLADAFLSHGQHAASLAESTAGLRLLSSILPRELSTSRLDRMESSLEFMRGMAYFAMDRLGEAEESLTRSLRGKAGLDPGKVHHRAVDEWHNAQSTLATVLEVQGDFDAAIAFRQQTIPRLVELKSQRPEDTTFREAHAWETLRQALAYSKSDRLDMALGHWGQARTLFQELLEEAEAGRAPSQRARAGYAEALIYLGAETEGLEIARGLWNEGYRDRWFIESLNFTGAPQGAW
jgi:tetratricopeptide (TPR) repeat protein